MPVQSLPWSIQGQTHPAEIARAHTAALMGAPIDAFTNAIQTNAAIGAHGVIATGSGQFQVTQNGTPNMSVNVAQGRAVIRAGNAASTLAGVYTVLNDAPVNVAISAADPTNPRIDLVVVQVRNAAEYGEAANDVRITVITGTPAAVPATPSLALFPNALVLAEVRVNAAVSSITNANITDRRSYASAIGGMLRGLSTNRPAASSGQLYFDLDTATPQLFSTAAWNPLATAITAQTTSISWVNIGSTPAGTLTYTLIGGNTGLPFKVLVFALNITAGTATASATPTGITLPFTSAVAYRQPVIAHLTNNTNIVVGYLGSSAATLVFTKTNTGTQFTAGDSVANTTVVGSVLVL